MSVVVENQNRELKPEQRQAAHTLGRHVSVTAGPGAGKTTVLVERYLHILRTHNVSVDQIVAITFTNRAANEMRERLRAELNALLWSPASAERARWMRHKRTLDSAIITTIHGFCARLLRDFPVEADLDPQFALLDAHQSTMLEEAVAEESLTDFINKQDQSITTLAAGVGRARLVRGLVGIYRAMRNQGITLDVLAEQTKNNRKSINDFNAAVEELTGKMREFMQHPGLSPAALVKQRAARERWPRLLELVRDALESESPADFCDAIREFREKARPTASPKVSNLVNQLDELIWEKNLRGRVPQIFVDLHAQRHVTELIKVIGAIEHRLDDEKRRHSVLDFDDLQLRTMRLLEQHPEVLRRTSSRYNFFLVDEFQDTNGLQRDLMDRLALGSDRNTNLFIVGDRKQSIYGFRGADVDVFREMTTRIEAGDGLTIPLNRNFRSQPSLIRFFNFLFERVFQHDGASAVDQLNDLGYVEHEPSIAARDDADAPPLVELLIDLRPDDHVTDRWSAEPPRERDGEQLAARIISLVGKESITDSESAGPRKLEHRDIALLFRAMTEVRIYESALRRAGIPYLTVQGQGFYAREEITDFIQLLRFLDNKTDEVALAAVLRSPICGLSDDTLLALRCAPALQDAGDRSSLRMRAGVRPLFEAVLHHQRIDFIDAIEHGALGHARTLLNELIRRAKRSRISELLRFAVDQSEYRTVAAANFDGGQRLSNLEKLFTLAQRFEDSGAYLIRDFVRFVREFEETGGRESEGEIDDSADAVRIMSIHQSKGLEFPVVIIPDLHRLPDNRNEWWALDRHRGLSVKVPDGRGRLVGGSTFTAFAERAKLREEFESMRLLYVAATRAQDRLILSGAAKDLVSLKKSWLKWICNALGVGMDSANGTLSPSEGVELRLTLNLLDALPELTGLENAPAIESQPLAQPGYISFPLLEPVRSNPSTALHRFSVTQLLNYTRCPRQHYFDRVLYVPSEEEVAVWSDADAPEPPANLTATLRGAVIHRFCEQYSEGDEVEQRLRSSFEHALRQRAAELGDRILEIDAERAIEDLLPLARNYLGSRVRQRIESARTTEHSALSTQDSAPSTQHSALSLGALSEQRFRLRRPLGILTGTIDKLLIQPGEKGGLNVEIIDFKTNRFRGGRPRSIYVKRNVVDGQPPPRVEQLSFGFLSPPSDASPDPDLLIAAEIQATAVDYQIQMQAYALAAYELMPDVTNVRVTLHFLDPDVEVSLPQELVDRDACASAIDQAMLNIVSSDAPESFPVNPADHCRVCNFVELCVAGRRWLSE